MGKTGAARPASLFLCQVVGILHRLPQSWTPLCLKAKPAQCCPSKLKGADLCKFNRYGIPSLKQGRSGLSRNKIQAFARSLLLSFQKVGAEKGYEAGIFTPPTPVRATAKDVGETKPVQ